MTWSPPSFFTTPFFTTQRILFTHPLLLLAALPSVVVAAVGQPGKSVIVNGLPAIRLPSLSAQSCISCNPLNPRAPSVSGGSAFSISTFKEIEREELEAPSASPLPSSASTWTEAKRGNLIRACNSNKSWDFMRSEAGRQA